MFHDRTLRIAVIVSVIVSFLVGGVMGGAAGALVALRPGLFVQAPLAALGIAPKPSVPAPSRQTVIEDSQTIGVVGKVNPAVVSIQISREVTPVSADFSPFPNDFFSGIPTPQQEPGNGTPQKRIVGGGSGFLVTGDGMIVTNRHVVEDTKADYTVVLADGRKFPAKVLARDPMLDLAVIKIDGTDFPTVTLGDSDALQVGQTVVAIGNTLAELSNTVTKGIVSGINRRITAGDGAGSSEVIEGAVQTDAAINPGNSGGPLVNLDGQVIGVNVAVNQSAQSVGFAIPINVVTQVVESVKKNGRIVRPWIGVRYVLLNADIAKSENLSVDHGALVVRGDTRTQLAVIPGSPADKAGIEENDIILAVDGQTVDEDHSLATLIGRKQPGDQVSFTVQHKGSEKTVVITLGELKSDQ